MPVQQPTPPADPQPSRPTQDFGAPHIGTDIPARDDQPVTWRDFLPTWDELKYLARLAFGSDR